MTKLEPKNKNATNTTILKQLFFIYLNSSKRPKQKRIKKKRQANKPNGIFFIHHCHYHHNHIYVEHTFRTYFYITNFKTCTNLNLILRKRRKFSLLTIFFLGLFSWHFGHLYIYFVSFQMTNSAQSKDLKIESKNSFYVSQKIEIDDKLSQKQKQKNFISKIKKKQILKTLRNSLLKHNL